MKYFTSNINSFYITVIIIFIFPITSCKKFIEVSAPITSTNASNVFTNDATAAAVLTDLYATISEKNSSSFTGTSLTSISLQMGLLSDEIKLYDLNNLSLLRYYTNDVSSEDAGFWNELYSNIFVCNSALEGLTNSKSLTNQVKNQLLGEAKFMRALLYFYLVNIYGDVPLVTSTDYKINSTLSRTSKNKVYDQLINDLISAQGLLSDNYYDGRILNTTTERIRPNKAAASALLARCYLYINDWKNAELQSSNVLNNTLFYDTVAINNVFIKESRETILALQPVGASDNSSANTGEGKLFILPETGPNGDQYPVYLNPELANSFETGDHRKDEWIKTIHIINNDTIKNYSFSYKYKVGNVNSKTKEYPIILRLAEQYLIRAESRAQQEDLEGALSDLNVIRLRAGLTKKTLSAKKDVLSAILHERQVELFSEWGHRWFDLKRMEILNTIMENIAKEKGGNWSSYKALLPIPQNEINRDKNIIQNPGYM